MASAGRSLEERFEVFAWQGLQQTFAQDVCQGLQANPKSLPCRYFYDHQGSLLFEEICQQPEYYLTRAETEILQATCGAIADAFDKPPTVTELGSGSGVKTRILLKALLQKFGQVTYVPIDISSSMLEQSSRQLLGELPGLRVRGICGEYAFGLKALRTMTPAPSPQLVLWLGSNVGNMARREAGQFLAELARLLAPEDRFLLGVDLLKDQAVLEAAYNDSAGVTERFNLNLLERLNRELGANFEVGSFCHRARFQADYGRIEMSLECQRSHRVRLSIPGVEINCEQGESIVTEHCYKYSPAQLDALLASAGMILEELWMDQEQRFGLAQLAAV